MKNLVNLVKELARLERMKAQIHIVSLGQYPRYIRAIHCGLWAAWNSALWTLIGILAKSLPLAVGLGLFALIVEGYLYWRMEKVLPEMRRQYEEMILEGETQQSGEFLQWRS